MERVSMWLASQLCVGQVERTHILDVGTGNGQMLVHLALAGFRQITGTDYVQDAVKLANSNFEAALSADGALGSQLSPVELQQLEVEFVQADIMAATAGGDGGDGVGGGEGERGGSDKGSSVKGSSCLRPGSYDLLHDKGTLDAISLRAPSRDTGAEPEAANVFVDRYIQRAHQLVKPGGKMVITSCNFSNDELRRMVEADGRWRSIGGLAYPALAYGGSQGSLLATQAFLRLPSWCD
eukprot:Tamp_28002.p1 GENE.Tamp_28002~~Tamp_28002.p1  ORF type:complete len:274 (+),score=43.04 Tamp_28002:109-822(+)